MNANVREAPTQLSTRWIADRMVDILPALMVGSMVSAVGMALLGNVMIRLIWRWKVSRSWKRRARRRGPQYLKDS